MAEIVGDWELDLLEPLVENMQRLAVVIGGRDFVENSDEIVAEIGEALALLSTWEEVGDRALDVNDYIDREEAAWWAFWVYLGEHIRGWWD